MDLLAKRLTNISKLSEQSMEEFLHAWKHWSAQKDYFLLKENTVSDYIYFN